MQNLKTGLVLVVALGLGACTNPDALGTNPDNPNSNRNRGALIGAGAGAVLGAIVQDDNRKDGALVGALVGAGVGAGVGYSLDRQEAELRRDLDNSGVTISNTGDRLIVTMPQDILFAVDSAVVNSGLRGDLGVLARSLQNYPQSTVQVIGHTDSDGDAAYNQALSERRASAVTGELLNNGVSTSRIQSFGRGESQPVASNLTAEGKAQNRRVDIVILPTT